MRVKLGKTIIDPREYWDQRIDLEVLIEARIMQELRRQLGLEAHGYLQGKNDQKPRDLLGLDGLGRRGHIG